AVVAVDAPATDQVVPSTLAEQLVGAPPAVEVVVAATAEQHVRVRAAPEVVEPRTARGPVATRAASEAVVAAPAAEEIVAPDTGDDVGPERALDHVVTVGGLVAGPQVDGHRLAEAGRRRRHGRGGRRRVVDRVRDP